MAVGGGEADRNEAQFTSSEGIDLTRDTTYWVVVDSSSSASNVDLGLITSKGEDQAASEWTIVDSNRIRANPSGTSWTSDSSNVLRIAVHGYGKSRPVLTNTGVNGTALTLTFDRGVDAGFKPADSAFSVTVAGSTRALTSGGVAISGSTVTLTLASAVTSGQTVTVSYTRPATNPLQHAGRLVPSFTDQAVTNNTP